ncbi:MAG: hypothetical protein QOI03_1804 [Solirubrobacteraceae bacterium]|jgi:hypothetical protein|nr:hypothetical protein [Solirubrobacteraceae bacterium]
MLSLAAAAAACASGSAAGPVDSGIHGRVLYGPTCPVQLVGQSCTRPYQATISVRSKSTGRLLARVRSSTQGYFSVRLAPGRYVLTPESGHPFPTSSPQSVVVYRHRYTSVTVRYDSGIR